MSCTNEELVAARVSNEEVEVARVCRAQGSVSQATTQLHVIGKTRKKIHAATRDLETFT